MEDKFYKEKKLKTTSVNLEVDHLEYLATLRSGSRKLRWLLSNDADFKQFMKEKHG